MTKEEIDARWEQVWAAGRDAGVKTLPFWTATLAKLREKAAEKEPEEPRRPPLAERRDAFLTRLQGRRDMAQGTAEKHPDTAVQASAKARAMAYDVALDDAVALLKD